MLDPAPHSDPRPRPDPVPEGGGIRRVQRYKLTIAYRGTRYYGWQTQAVPASYTGEMPPEGHGLPTIQEIVQRTLAGVIGHPITLVGSSRTDTGVHAKGQLAHLDTTATHIPIEGLRRATNHRLPDDIVIRSIEPVTRDFHAILSTASKRYQYVIWNAPDRPPFFSDLVWHRWQTLDRDAMIAAAAAFEGTHDFQSFSKPRHGRATTTRTMRACRLSVRGPRLIIGVEGSGFLWNMVRIMVGTIVDVGLGRRHAEEVPGMLAARDRTAAGSTAPPHGLWLQWIRMNQSVVTSQPLAEDPDPPVPADD